VLHFPDVIYTLMEIDNWRCSTILGYETLERSRLWCFAVVMRCYAILRLAWSVGTQLNAIGSKRAERARIWDVSLPSTQIWFADGDLP
jgi:hypothetical protein